MDMHTNEFLWTFTQLLILGSTSANCIIYAFMCSKFRASFKKLLSSFCQRKYTRKGTTTTLPTSSTSRTPDESEASKKLSDEGRKLNEDCRKLTKL